MGLRRSGLGWSHVDPIESRRASRRVAHVHVVCAVWWQHGDGVFVPLARRPGHAADRPQRQRGKPGAHQRPGQRPTGGKRSKRPRRQ
jgi:hypothetical protein